MKKHELKPRIRVMCGAEIALGPGKIELLQLIDKTGNLRDAAKQMDMSYMRAWTLVQTMNRSFSIDLVTLARGGRKGGSAGLTPQGRRVLALYLEIERTSLRASIRAWSKLRGCLRK